MSETPRVYVLVYSVDYETMLCGVFSSPQRAEQARDQIMAVGRCVQGMEIDEIEVDATASWMLEPLPLRQARS